MNKYLLDTDICIFYLKGKFGLDKKCTAVGYENCFVSEITIAELIYGAHKSTDYKRHKMDAIRVSSLIKVLPIFASLSLYGKERARLEKLGTRLEDFDLLIGTTAVHHQLTLVTNNTRHMERIAGIRLENWTTVADNEFVG